MQCSCWLLKAAMLSCWQPTRPIFFQLSLKASYCIRAQERRACPHCVLMVSVRGVIWGNWPLLIMYFVPGLRAPVDPSSEEQCMWLPLGNGIETSAWWQSEEVLFAESPQLDPMTVIHQELVINPVSHSIAAWHLHFLYLSAEREPNHYPQWLLPSSP